MEYDVAFVIEKLADMGYIRPVKPSGNWYQICCPIHNNGRERKPSCGVLLHDEYRNGELRKQGSFHCFSCHYSKNMPDAITDIFAMHGLTVSGDDWMVQNVPGYKVDNSKIQNLVPQDMMTDIFDSYAADSLRMRFKAKPTYVSESELASYRMTVPYMYQRRLTDEIIEKYDVGYDANHIPPGRSKPLPCITFPVRDINGNTLFFCRRSIEGKYFNYPKGVEKPVYGLYELPKDCKSVIICESIFNCLTAVAYGFNAVALMGTGNQLQIRQLRQLGVREYIICLDNDDAGNSGAEKLKKALSDTAFTWKITVPEGRDVNQLEKEEFLEVYNNKE